MEVVLLIGEPTHWESNLQLLLDLLLTQGKPTEAPTDVHSVPQIPIIACNMDLVFMAEACMPRSVSVRSLACQYHRLDETSTLVVMPRLVSIIMLTSQYHRG